MSVNCQVNVNYVKYMSIKCQLNVSYMSIILSDLMSTTYPSHDHYMTVICPLNANYMSIVMSVICPSYVNYISIICPSSGLGFPGEVRAFIRKYHFWGT